MALGKHLLQAVPSVYTLQYLTGKVSIPTETDSFQFTKFWTHNIIIPAPLKLGGAAAP